MNVLLLLVPAAIALAAVGVGAFVWAVRSGQFDDVDTPAIRILIDDIEEQNPSPERNTSGPEDQPIELNGNQD